MPYKILRKTSNCKDCPLEGGILNKCYGVSDSEKPQIAFIGEAPGREEDECGTPFVGASGRMLKGTVAEIGRKFYLAHKTNVIICRPPNNKFDTLEAQDAVQCCRKGFIDELKALKKKGTKVLVAVGSSAAHALNIPGSISKNRGSVYMINIKDDKLILTDKAPYDFICVPTFHPSFLFRGQLKHEVSFINDLEKAYSIVDKGYKPPKEKFNLYPTIKDLEKFRDKVLKNKTPLGVDIETTSLAPGRGRILMVGLACSAEEAIVIPFCKQHGKAYWSSMDRMKAHDILKELMAKSPTIFQNALFDTRWLEHFGTPVKNLQHDTMILHHCLTGDTEIDTLDYGRVPIKDLEGKENFYVISHNGEKLVPKKVSRCWSSGVRKDLVRVTFWSKSRINKSKMWIDCTVDHEFPVQGKTKKVRADQLKPGDRLFPGQTNTGMVGKKIIHRWVYESCIGPLADNDVHHKDGNHFNNNPDNLKAVTKSEHNKYHKNNQYKATAIMMRKAHEKRERKVDTAKVLNLYFDVGLSYREVAEELNCPADLVISVLKHSGKKLRGRSEATKLRWEKARNARIISVTPLATKGEEVFDMTVPDTHVFSANGVIVSNCISPELPHNLGYIVSVYGKTPYWKETIHKPERLIDLPDEESRSYNARDCVTLKQILPELIKEAKEDKTYKVYETIAMKLVNPVMMLMRNGVKIDQAALKKWKTSLKRKIKSREKKLYEIAKLPETFNLSSPDHMRLLLFGEKPARFDKIIKELGEYKKDPKKNRTTKRFKALAADYDLFCGVKPFYNPIVYKKKTDSGKLAIDKEVMISIQVAANNELARISKLKRRKPEHDVKEAACKKLTEFITAYREYTALSKLDSTYTKFPVDESSRVKFPYRITGTNTGRFASGDKKAGEAGNAQNLPDEAKHIFVAEKGKTLLYGDYSNLELRVTAAVTGDKPLQDVFASGLKVHKINQDLLFGLKEDHPLYKHAYRACKTYIFGRGYGGGLQGIHRRLVQAVPELNLTFEKFCEIDSKYKKAHKAITKWEEKTKDTVLADRCLNNAFGRVRYFLGSDNEITREGLNFPIQSTAADILNMSLIRISDAIDKGILKSKLIITVHDSIGFEVPDNLLKKEAKIIKGLMEAPVKIKGKSYVFPVDFEVGKDWGHLTEYEI